ncbi:MAG: hypothetical protein ACOZCO_10645 [Bacteroidota bacterium]
MESNQKQTFELRPYIKKELYTKLKVSKYHLNKVIKNNKEEIGEIDGTLLTIKQVKIIVQRLGIPHHISAEE